MTGKPPPDSIHTYLPQGNLLSPVVGARWGMYEWGNGGITGGGRHTYSQRVLFNTHGLQAFLGLCLCCLVPVASMVCVAARPPPTASACLSSFVSSWGSCVCGWGGGMRCAERVRLGVDGFLTVGGSLFGRS